MRLLHINGKDFEDYIIDEYIVIDKIEGFRILKIENTIRYKVNLIADRVIPIAIQTSEPKKIVEGLLNTINTIDNEIIEYSIKED